MKTYFILDPVAGAIKIGKSTAPRKRLRELQIAHAHPLKLLGTLDGDHEASLHRHWNPIALSGEWFRATDELRWFIFKRLGGTTTPLKEDCCTGLISARRHYMVMANAYTRYCKNALLEGMPPEMLLGPFPPLTTDSEITAQAHQKHLTLARRKYSEHLAVFHSGRHRATSVSAQQGGKT